MESIARQDNSLGYASRPSQAEPDRAIDEISDGVRQIRLAIQNFSSVEGRKPHLDGINNFLRMFDGTPHYPFTQALTSGFNQVRKLIEEEGHLKGAHSLSTNADTVLTAQIAGVLSRWMSPVQNIENTVWGSKVNPSSGEFEEVSREILANTVIIESSDAHGEIVNDSKGVVEVVVKDCRILETDKQYAQSFQGGNFLAPELHSEFSVCLYCERQQIASAGRTVDIQLIRRRIDQSLIYQPVYRRYGPHGSKQAWTLMRDDIIYEMKVQIELLKAEGFIPAKEIENEKDCIEALRKEYTGENKKGSQKSLLTSLSQRVFSKLVSSSSQALD
ncbi:hypothetical protein V1512DRAFT_135495 [Lipomyces arxii]|uniref:uncharacterized protein n=1 Tax=Lipomyces arxii TaxID=56418 RepID=UPI0034CFA1AA